MNILITGKNSYIGKNVRKWLENRMENVHITELDLRNGFKQTDFLGYNVIFHVAGIAHFSKSVEKKELYYKVNRDLAVSVAKQAKLAGVKQFIFMSSILVYGDSSERKRVINLDTVPTPTDFYGDSKLQAEKELVKLQDEDFNIAIIRPPMIYGKGTKGNYARLSKLAKITFLFPNIKNERSMLYIDNLSEFIRNIIIRNDKGIFFPQNEEYVCTSELVKVIAKVNNKTVYLTKLFNPLVRLFFRFDVIKKVFGSLVYNKSMSEYPFNYKISNFEESIKNTEK